MVATEDVCQAGQGRATRQHELTATLVLANPASGFGDGSAHFGSVQNVLLHTVTPLLALLDWVLVGLTRPRWRWALGWLSYPLAYLAFALVRGLMVREYPYPFLDVSS